MTTVRAEEIEAIHPELPSDWSGQLGEIEARGGPWACPSCGETSLLQYRCSRCGHDMAGASVSGVDHAE